VFFRRMHGGNVIVTGDSYRDFVTRDIATIAYSNAGVPLWTNRYNGPANGDDVPLTKQSLALGPGGSVRDRRFGRRFLGRTNSRFRNDQIRHSRTIALYHTFECLCHFVVADKRAELSVAGKRKPLPFKWLVGCCRAAFDEQGFHFRDPACHRQPQILSAELAVNRGTFLRGFARPIRMTDWKGHVYERIEIVGNTLSRPESPAPHRRAE